MRAGERVAFVPHVESCDVIETLRASAPDAATCRHSIRELSSVMD
jgi:hypothetical protein